MLWCSNKRAAVTSLATKGVPFSVIGPVSAVAYHIKDSNIIAVGEEVGVFFFLCNKFNIVHRKEFACMMRVED
jgi:hypothetical protein